MSPKIPSSSGPMRGQAPRRRGPTRISRWRQATQRDETAWGRRLARIWGVLLVLGFLMPLSYTYFGRAEGKRFLFAWDTFEHVDTLTIVWILMPLMLGLTACLVARARRRPLGAVLLIGGLCVSAIPVIAAGPMLAGPLAEGTPRLIVLWLVILLAPPAIAGANHVARHAGGDAFLRILIGLGGLALLLVLFVPLQSGMPSIMGLIFDSGGPLGSDGQAWPMLLWLLIVLMYAVVAALYLIPSVRTETFGPWLSMGGRFALYGLPVVILVFALVSGGFGSPGFLPGLLILTGGILRLYGVMILTALGLALTLDRSPEPVKPAEMVKAFE